jgi:O-acetylhomoserine/O-acetylserine sulfhydrylase-like pyridoxal-dependent enzyme
MISWSLETLSIRVEKADRNARLVADYLRDHAKVAKRFDAVAVKMQHHRATAG